VGQQSAAKATATITMATMQSNNQRQARWTEMPIVKIVNKYFNRRWQQQEVGKLQ